MGRPLFSIITITFNAAGTLPATLRSVERQTFTDYEYLIVDGASTDGTIAIAQHSAAVSSVTSEPDKGLYDAMNKGLRKARGCYLVFLNAGDAFHEPDTLQKIADSIEKTDPDIVYGETALVDSERRFISMRRLQAPERLSVKKAAWGAGVPSGVYRSPEIAPNMICGIVFPPTSIGVSGACKWRKR